MGHPIRHSLSPRLHGAWIDHLGLDAAYVPLRVAEGGFERLVDGLKGGVFAGLNVTLPFKERALVLADEADEAARRAGAANLLVFSPDERIMAKNTDGLGLFYAFQQQTPHWRADQGPVVVLGAGGAARGAVAALMAGGAKDVRVLNRTLSRAEAIAADLGCSAFGWDQTERAFDGVATLVNATSGGLSGGDALPTPPPATYAGAVAMDMVYTPLKTAFLQSCEHLGYAPVDGLDMLIGQARPSFAAFYGVSPPEAVDSRAILLAALAGQV